MRYSLLRSLADAHFASLAISEPLWSAAKRLTLAHLFGLQRRSTALNIFRKTSANGAHCLQYYNHNNNIDSKIGRGEVFKIRGEI